MKFHANDLTMLYTNYIFLNNTKNILVCNFDLDKNIYRNKIMNNNIIFDVDKNYDTIDLKINFYYYILLYFYYIIFFCNLFFYQFYKNSHVKFLILFQYLLEIC